MKNEIIAILNYTLINFKNQIFVLLICSPLNIDSNKILKHRYVNKSVSKLSPLRNELVEEFESKRQTQQNFLSNKELVGEFQIKDQNDVKFFYLFSER